MAAHRYWRVDFFAAGNGGATLLAEIEMRESIGGASVCVGGVASASSVISGSAAALFDGNVGTDWYGGGQATTWVRYDFGGTPRDIVELALRSSGSAGLAPLYAVLLWSDDDSHWVALGPVSYTGDMGANNWRVLSGFSPAAAPRIPARTTRLVLAGRPEAVSPRVAGRVSRHDPLDGGRYRIPGTVALDGTPGPNTPVRREVRLYSKQSGRYVRQTWSDAETGAYSFDGLALKEFFVVTHDHLDFYDAVIHDAITPELMP